MELPINWGDVPTWLQAAGGLAQLGHAVWHVQSERALRFTQHLRDCTGLDDEEMADAVRTDEGRAALTFRGIQLAMQAGQDEQLRLLARALAAAFDGDNARFDETALLLRTAGGLDTQDMRLLAALAIPRPSTDKDAPPKGSMLESELAAALDEDQGDLVAPIVATLAREGLVVDEAVGAYGYRASYRLTPYGFRFLHYLPESLSVDVNDATLAGYHGNWGLRVRNLGPGGATLTGVMATCDGRPLMKPPALPMRIGPGSETTYPADNTVPKNGGARISLIWTDDGGQTHTSDRISWRR